MCEYWVLKNALAFHIYSELHQSESHMGRNVLQVDKVKFKVVNIYFLCFLFNEQSFVILIADFNGVFSPLAAPSFPVLSPQSLEGVQLRNCLFHKKKRREKLICSHN